VAKREAAELLRRHARDFSFIPLFFPSGSPNTDRRLVLGRIAFAIRPPSLLRCALVFVIWARTPFSQPDASATVVAEIAPVDDNATRLRCGRSQFARGRLLRKPPSVSQIAHEGNAITHHSGYQEPPGILFEQDCCDVIKRPVPRRPKSQDSIFRRDNTPEFAKNGYVRRKAENPVLPAFDSFLPLPPSGRFRPKTDISSLAVPV
jgi:hypothetical protein